jgi:hypothetical protein
MLDDPFFAIENAIKNTLITIENQRDLAAFDNND